MNRGIGLVILHNIGWNCVYPILGNKVVHKMIIYKYNAYKKQYQKDQQTIKSFVKLSRKSLQDNVIDGNEIETLRKTLSKYLEETKMNLFYKYEQKEN